MSPLSKPVIIDNDVISRLFSAGALPRALEVWPRGTFYITIRVLDEARQWKSKGKELVTILKELERKGIIRFTDIDDRSEDEISAYAVLLLTNKLGRGESASIAIAQNRNFDIADDSNARGACRRLYPSVSILGTGNLLNLAVRDGLITQREANSIREKIRSFSR